MAKLQTVAAHILVLALGLTLTACVPSLQGLVIPTPLPAQAAASPAPSATSISTAAVAISPTASFTPIPTFTPVNGTGAPLTPPLTMTGTQATAAGPTPASTVPAPTSTVLITVSMDKLPSDTVYKPIVIRNKSRAQMDISLHCTTHQGLQTVIEYERVRTLSAQVPQCDYVYVVWVGGRQIVGSFTLYRVPDLAITVYANRVEIH